jgi:hypothetical protein
MALAALLSDKGDTKFRVVYPRRAHQHSILLFYKYCRFPYPHEDPLFRVVSPRRAHQHHSILLFYIYCRFPYPHEDPLSYSYIWVINLQIWPCQPSQIVTIYFLQHEESGLSCSCHKGRVFSSSETHSL